MEEYTKTTQVNLNLPNPAYLQKAGYAVGSGLAAGCLVTVAAAIGLLWVSKNLINLFTP